MANGSQNEDQTLEDGILPSKFMRQLRPEYYSDTEGRTDYVLDAPLLEYHLESLTQRNQTHDFEIFCRKLCERAIARNLRPQTGPDGGGDSKADTETYPVSEEVSELYYEGEADSGEERWAFAFSAKETWKQKARDDIKGLIETGRTYDRIIFVTSRFAKAKDRAALEDELSNKAGIPVTIHDRTWIVSEIIEKGRKDLAFNYLGVGTEVSDASKLGPTDYSRQQQLDEIESAFDNPDGHQEIEQHRVVDALLAAKLSRGLEQPRVNVDGRFERAVRLADKYGTLHQRVEARYEHVWTAYWWYDDFEFLDTRYGAIEALVADAGHARTISLLVNLIQLLFNSVLHGHLGQAACQLDARIVRVRDLLSPMAADAERPNNRLEAASLLLHLDMNEAILAHNEKALTQVWQGYSDILDRADGLGEFDAERVRKMIEVAEGVADDDPEYSALIDKLSDFVTARTGEAQGALVLLRRATKLDLTRHFEMIRLLSKAAMQLTKKEYSSELTDALSHLTIAYRSAGLLWAARATAIFTLSTMIIEAEEGDRLPPRFAILAKVWAWLALDLQHWPDFINAMGLFRGATEGLPFGEEAREKLRRDALDLDMVAGSRLLNLSDADLAGFSTWPDILEASQLMMPRTALLYTLGYEDVLRADGSIAPQESDEEVKGMFSMLASQPAGAVKTATGPIRNAKNEQQVLSTKLIGMELAVRTSGSDHAILVAEAIVGSIEAFFATSIEQQIMPHTERFSIEVVEDAAASDPAFMVDLDTMSGRLIWPADMQPAKISAQDVIRSLWIDVAAQVLGAAFFIPDAEQTLEAMTRGERVFQRMSLVTSATFSYHRMNGRYLTRPGDLIEGEVRDYAPRSPRPVVEKVDLTAVVANQRGVSREEVEEREPAGQSHLGVGVRSVIDLHLWDRAGWRGFGWFENQPGFPPFVALIFSNEEAAAKIFERWRTNIAPYDEHDRIRLSIVRHLPDQDPFFYAVQITANALPGELEKGQVIGFTSRSLVVTPKNHQNLEGLLARYAQFGAYYLIPAVWNEAMPEPKFLEDLPVLKRQLNVVDAVDVTQNDIEWMAVEQSKRSD